MKRPELIIMDEPAAGLDPLMQQEFYALIEEVKAEGRTIFISSHFVPEVERINDRVAILRAGELVTVEDVRVLNPHSPVDFPCFGTRFAPNPWKTGVRTINMPR